MDDVSILRRALLCPPPGSSPPVSRDFSFQTPCPTAAHAPSLRSTPLPPPLDRAGPRAGDGRHWRGLCQTAAHRSQQSTGRPSADRRSGDRRDPGFNLVHLLRHPQNPADQGRFRTIDGAQPVLRPVVRNPTARLVQRKLRRPRDSGRTDCRISARAATTGPRRSASGTRRTAPRPGASRLRRAAAAAFHGARF